MYLKMHNQWEVLTMLYYLSSKVYTVLFTKCFEWMSYNYDEHCIPVSMVYSYIIPEDWINWAYPLWLFHNHHHHLSLLLVVHKIRFMKEALMAFYMSVSPQKEEKITHFFVFHSNSFSGQCWTLTDATRKMKNFYLFWT